MKNQEAIGNALALNGKSGPQYDKEIQSIAGGNFDPNLLYLNDEGTKEVEKLYYDRLKSGVFKCIKQTTSTVNSTEFFVDVSSLQNANRLDNLCAFQLVKTGVIEKYEDYTEIFDFSIYHSNGKTSRLEIVLVLRRKSREWWGTRFTKFATWARLSEEITTIYDHKNGSYTTPEILFERSTHKLKIKPVEQVSQFYDIYVCKFTY